MVLTSYAKQRVAISRHARGQSLSAWYLLCVIAMVAATYRAVGPASETDLFWHIKVGQILVAQHGWPRVDPWNYTFPTRTWRTTQWLSEVAFYLIYRVGGLFGLDLVHLFLAAGLCAAIGLFLIPRSVTPWVYAGVYASVVTGLIFFDQMRPELLSYYFLIWLSVLCWRSYRTRRSPSPIAIACMTWLWANFHGYWILVPVALAGTATAIALDTRRRDLPEVKKLLLGAVGATAAALLTPIGPYILASVIAISAAAKPTIEEWGATPLFSRFALGLDVLILLTTTAWARAKKSVPLGEIFWTAGWVCFGAFAIRDVAPAMILLAPWVAGRLHTTFGTRRSSEPRIQPRLLPALAVLGIALATYHQFQVPALDPSKPLAIAETLSQAKYPIRVMDDYNISGFLILESGSRIKTAIDGRSDRYGAAFISRYANAEEGIGWRPLLAQLIPDVAVLPRRAPLCSILVRQARWHVVMYDSSWELLQSPASRFRPKSG